MKEDTSSSRQLDFELTGLKHQVERVSDEPLAGATNTSLPPEESTDKNEEMNIEKELSTKRKLAESSFSDQSNSNQTNEVSKKISVPQADIAPLQQQVNTLGGDLLCEWNNCKRFTKKQEKNLTIPSLQLFYYS